ncbi:ndufa2, NADH:ubiquinone oxidoreductase 10.5kD subunit [Aphanomyces cochlioides]|nr:ndufa2, NADH:ubiquinone oxidoreductase 10.5kD subunit [Aphanomyces cochlioides]
MSWRAQISRNIQEIRIVACTTSDSSTGLRKFFRRNYAELKMLNPRTPFVYREAEGVEPFVYARYDWGVEQQVYVKHKSADDIVRMLKELTQFGETTPRSPESDILLAEPIVDGRIGEDEYPPINITWDGKTIRRNPDFKVEA